MSETITHICFDWGGVILKICRSWEEGCAQAGIKAPNKKLSTKCYKKLKALEPRYQTGQMSDKAYFRAISRECEEFHSIDDVAAVHHAWLIEEYEGVDELIDELNEFGDLTVGLFSNTNALHWARMDEDFQTASRIEHRHASHLFGLAKPDEKAFAAYERRVGAAGQQILFFDDSPENIKGATEFGWVAKKIDHAKGTANQIRAHLEKLSILEPA